MKKYIIGIISYLPDDNYDARKERLEQTLARCYELFPTFPIVIVAQNFRDNFIPNHNENQTVYMKYYDKLGIVKARRTLQEELLNYDFNYAILLDDDAIIYGEDVEGFLLAFEKVSDGFCFRQRQTWEAPSSLWRYVSACLNMCVISKYILEREFIDLRFDPQNNITYEDIVYPVLLHNKYPDREIYYPIGTLFTSFDTGQNIQTTWAVSANNEHLSEHPWTLRWNNSAKVVDYIDKYKKYPNFKLDENKNLIILED